MGHKNRLRGHLQRAQHRLRTGVGQVNHDPQAVALLHHLCAKSRQTTKMSGGRNHIPQRRHNIVSLVKQLKIAHPAFVHLFHSLQAPLDEL